MQIPLSAQRLYLQSPSIKTNNRAWPVAPGAGRQKKWGFNSEFSLLKSLATEACMQNQSVQVGAHVLTHTNTHTQTFIGHN